MGNLPKIAVCGVGCASLVRHIAGALSEAIDSIKKPKYADQKGQPDGFTPRNGKMEAMDRSRVRGHRPPRTERSS
jgi:hypothetical protein